MQIPTVVVALGKRKTGALLIAAQIALTLAVVCNAFHLVDQRIDRLHRATGMDESDLFLVSQNWIGAAASEDSSGEAKRASLLQSDLHALVQLPSVKSVSSINTVPLYSGSDTGTISQKWDNSAGSISTRTAIYLSDSNVIQALGLHLVAGRSFNPTEVERVEGQSEGASAVVLITNDLAEKLFPGADAVGRQVYLNGGSSASTVIGVVAKLQSSDLTLGSAGEALYSVIEPTETNSSSTLYAVRAKPGQMERAMKATRPALFGIDPMRVLDDDGVESFADVRRMAYRSDRGMAIMMTGVCIVLLGITVASITGLTVFWVYQRRREIGIRRAVGARKIDILMYFQIENIVISSAGVIAGVPLAEGLSLLLMHKFEVSWLPISYLIVSVVLVLILGQIAAWSPARMASRVPPAVATRQ